MPNITDDFIKFLNNEISELNDTIMYATSPFLYIELKSKIETLNYVLNNYTDFLLKRLQVPVNNDDVPVC